MQCRRLTAAFEILTSIALLLSTLSDSHLLQMGRLEDGRSLLLKVCWVRAIRKESGSDAFGWGLTSRQCTIDPKPTTDAVNSIEAIQREVQHRSAVRQATLGMLFHRHGQRTDLHLQLRVRTPDPWLVVADHASQREGAADEHFRATGGVDRFEVTAVEADAEGSCSVQGSCPNQDLIIVNHRTRHLHVLQESRSTLVSAVGQHVSSYNKFRHRVWLARFSSWCRGWRRGTGRTRRSPFVDRLLSWHQGIRQGVPSFRRGDSSIRGIWRIGIRS